ncbi:MAG TPA: NAD(P)-dependent oxidoreductase [Myxococcota bacterium]
MGIRSLRPGDVERFKKSADAAAFAKAKKLETTEAPSLPTTTTTTTNSSSAALPVVDSFAIRRPNGANNVTGTNGVTTTSTTATTSAKQQQLAVTTSTAPQRTVEEEGPQAVLRALVVKPPVLPGAPAPSAGALERLVTQNIGAAARHLSPTEQARVLGHPEWAEALAARSGSARRGQGDEPNWLLAAQLTRWMRGIDAPGISLADVARSFKAANAMAQAAVPHLDGAFVAQLQKAYPFMPQWTNAPPRIVANDDWSMLGDLTSDAANADVWTQKLDAALQGISEVPLTLALTNSVGERLAASQPFKKHNVVMVQHMLGQAIPLCAELARAGMQMDKAEYVGVPYQKNPAVKLSLERSMGLKVTVPERGDIDGMWEHVCAAVDRAYERHLHNGEPILILDDGGYASKYIATTYADKADLFCVVEQTTRGLTEIAQIDPKPTFPIANVAGSYGKRFESAQVGDAVVQCVRRVLDEVATTPTRKEVLVVGGGKVGVGVADSFKGDGARVTFFDPYITPSRKKEIEALGYTVITDKAQALDKKFLVVGCSGHRSIDMNDFLKMSSPVFIASASSKRVEIDTLGLAELTKGDDGVMRRILAAKVNEQETWHYWTQDGRIVTAVADGLPANFQDVNSIAPELIDHTMALMVLGAEKAVQARTKSAGLVELDAGQQFELQARMEGLTQQRGSTADLELQVGGLSFFGSKDAWLAIAKSPATPPAVTDALIDRFLETEPMHPVLLEALHQPKEISDASLDKILALGVLAHVSRLMKNEGLRGDQEDRLVEWCNRAYEAVNGGNRSGEPLNIHGVEKRPDGAWSYARTLRPATADERARGYVDMPTGTTHERDLITRQLGEILFAHPRCPEGFKDWLLDDRTGSKLRFEQQANVHALKNPTWTTTQLEQLIERGAPFLYSLGIEKPQRAAYALDVFEALREHPSASEQVIAQADRAIGYITQQQMERRNVEPLGKRGWVESPLGGLVPSYA